MQFIITDAWLARSRVIHLSGTRLLLALAGSTLALMLVAALLYHWVILKGAREGWPLVGTLVHLVARDDLEQRDRYVQENIDAMARKLGEMQARLVQLEALGERVSGLAGVASPELKASPARGGRLVADRPLSLPDLQAAMDGLEQAATDRVDLLGVLESRLVEQKVRQMMVPTQMPVPGSPLGSAFGWRIDPFTGRSALHTGLDFEASPGTAIKAAAGGVVVAQELHPAYGQMVEVDHGNGLVTRYAHASRVLVRQGDLVRRGQKIAEVGSTGRSTGPHLHFEVLVGGIPQDPRKFLDAGRQLAAAGPARPGRAAR